MTLTFCCAVLALEIGVVFGILGGNALACLYESAARHPVDWIVLGLPICSVVGVVFGPTRPTRRPTPTRLNR